MAFTELPYGPGINEHSFIAGLLLSVAKAIRARGEGDVPRINAAPIIDVTAARETENDPRESAD